MSKIKRSPLKNRKSLEGAYEALKLDIDLLKGQDMDKIESGFPKFSQELVEKLLEDKKVADGLLAVWRDKLKKESEQKGAIKEAALRIAVCFIGNTVVQADQIERILGEVAKEYPNVKLERRQVIEEVTSLNKTFVKRITD